MKIIDQYIYAIGQKLPMKGRSEVKRELKSLLLDDIESRFGNDPSEEEVKKAIADFGTPGKVARRYAGQKLVIASGFTDLYFMIFAIIIFAMAVAFTTIFFINLFTQELNAQGVLKEIGNIVLNTWNTSLSGIGMMTIIFIIITRFLREGEVDLEEDWTPNELKGIELGDEAESKVESIITIVFLLILLVIINIFPQLMSMAERAFEANGIMRLGNHIDTERFAFYAIFLSVIWMGEVAYNGFILRTSVKTKALSLLQNGLDITGIVLILIMVLDPALFVANPQATIPGFIGFKAVFLIILVVSSIELIVRLVKIALGKIEKKM